MTEDQIKGLVRRFDTNGDGKISKRELRVGLKSLGLRFAFFRSRRALRYADTNGDGVISEDEINELARYLIDAFFLALCQGRVMLSMVARLHRMVRYERPQKNHLNPSVIRKDLIRPFVSPTSIQHGYKTGSYVNAVNNSHSVP
nr:calcium-binding EF-hand [Tanacetum cinerariifolium]